MSPPSKKARVAWSCFLNPLPQAVTCILHPAKVQCPCLQYCNSICLVVALQGLAIELCISAWMTHRNKPTLLLQCRSLSYLAKPCLWTTGSEDCSAIPSHHQSAWTIYIYSILDSYNPHIHNMYWVLSLWSRSLLNLLQSFDSVQGLSIQLLLMSIWFVRSSFYRVEKVSIALAFNTGSKYGDKTHPKTERDRGSRHQHAPLAEVLPLSGGFHSQPGKWGCPNMFQQFPWLDKVAPSS